MCAPACIESRPVTTNDNNFVRGAVPPVPDAHGAAALLLIESLIHSLCEHAVLNTNQAVEIVERAVDVQYDLAIAADEAGEPHWHSHTLLQSIAASLGIDADDDRSFPRLVL